MKINKTIFFAFLVTLFAVSNLVAQPSCPTCPAQDAPGIPIDQGIGYLVIAALFLGISVIFKNRRKEKTSV